MLNWSRNDYSMKMEEIPRAQDKKLVDNNNLDASCYALLTRLAKSFTMRYPLEDFEGSYGTISGGNTEAASRYTEMRLGELGSLLYEGIEKDCISTWFNNYDDTEQFPSVVPSLGFYNICNGSLGLATGI